MSRGSAGRNAETDTLGLIESEFLAWPDGEASHRFKHAITQEVCYQQIPFQQRRPSFVSQVRSRSEEALQRIQQSTKTSLFADPRAAKRKLTVVGEVRCGDLLAAIAQMVTGTFRRVGSDYLLTSDLMGLGTRKVKFDQWEADIRAYQNQMSKDWYQQISKGSVLREVKTSARDPYQPSAQMDEYLAKEFPGLRDVSPSLIDDGIRGIVDRFNHEYSSQPTSTDGIRAENYFELQFCVTKRRRRLRTRRQPRTLQHL